MSEVQGQNGQESHKIPHRKKAFLVAFAATGNISAAAEAAQIDRTTHYDWMRTDPAYPQLFQSAKEIATERLELEARRRAEKGVQKLKTHNGKPIMVPSDLSDPNSPQVPLVEHEYSDTLMIFLLKSLRPDTYRERYEHEHGGIAGKAIAQEHVVSVDLRRLTDDQVDQLEAIVKDVNRRGAKLLAHDGE